MITTEQLKEAAAAYQVAAALRQQRDQLIRQALHEGWTVRAIGAATGLSIGRITQIRTGSR